MASPGFASLEHERPGEKLATQHTAATKQSAVTRQSAVTKRRAPVRREVAPALVVGHADDHAERDADRAADSVLARLDIEFPEQHQPGSAHGAVQRTSASPATPVVGREGGPLDADMSTRIDRARAGGSALAGPIRSRMEAGFGRSLGDVRVHTGAESAALSRAISARAFTTGNDIFFGAGEYSPGTPDGERVLAHELAHTMQSTGIQRQVIHRKLRGTADALENMGGAPTSNIAQRIVKKLTNWDEILGGVREYERVEAKLLLGGVNPSPVELLKIKPTLLKRLRNIEQSIANWHKANGQGAADALSDEWHDKATVGFIKNPEAAPAKQRRVKTQQATDDRQKAGRRQAIAMLQPRIGNESALLNSKDPRAWPSSLGLSPDKVTNTGATDAGQKNSVQELNYDTEAGSFKGFFKQEKGFNDAAEPHELHAGIRQADPNYGARSVALYRLDQLLNAGVTARAEFAVHKDANGASVLGTVLESATGKNASEVRFGQNAAHAQAMGPDAIGLDDPTLQRGLNKLQILDAIAGQLDRHEGNYFIEGDGKGGVTKITGIDLDMAFGADMTSIDYAPIKGLAQNYKGLPAAIDAEMGRTILKIKPDDIRDALTGLLTKAEVDATVSRFLEVQARVQEAEKKGELREQWNATEPLARPKATDMGFGDNRTSYAQHAAYGSLISLRPQVAAIADRILSGELQNPRYLANSQIAALNAASEDVVQAYVLSAHDADYGAVQKALSEYIFDNAIEHNEFQPLIMFAYNSLLSPTILAKVKAAVEEEPGVPGQKAGMRELATELRAQLPTIAAKFAQLQKGQRRRQAYPAK